MSKQVILTGLRANNDLHLGNYFGALLPLIDMAKSRAGDFQLNLFVPDLHSFTTPIDHSQLQTQILNNIRLFIAAGLPINNPDVYIYRQSYISAHSELTWILDCFTGFGQLSRMTQFKEKTKILQLDTMDAIASRAGIDAKNQHVEATGGNITVGLFNYPVLMAADILLYGATYVPVGDDQSQHLEFTRDIAQRMNSKFGEDLFTVPLEVKKQHELFSKDQGLRIMDLADPTKKMSKSDESGKGVIFLGDSPEVARKKIMSATTDSLSEIGYDQKTRPGITNLIDLLALLLGVPSEEVYSRFKGQTQYGPLKNELADVLADFLAKFQTRLADVEDTQLNQKLLTSEDKMRHVANTTLLKVQKAIGLR